MPQAYLTSAKAKKLTPTEKEYLRGLLLGRSPKEIAKALHKDVGGVRVALCALYRYVETLTHLSESTVHSRNFTRVLEKAGYSLSNPPQPPIAPIVPSVRQRQAILISYYPQEPDISVAQQLQTYFQDGGHQVFMTQEHQAEWWSRLNSSLERCDYFLLLLSEQSAISEMVTEELRLARELQDSLPEKKPAILALWVDSKSRSSVNYDLGVYLEGIWQRQWSPEAVQDVLNLVSRGQAPAPPGSKSTLPSPKKSSDHPPLPTATPELPEGQVKLASAFYVERPPIEQRCYETIVQPGALIRIKAPRQMGKTSLMARILYHAEQQGYRTVSLSFQLADKQRFFDLDQFLQWFCLYVGQKLGLPNHLSEYWDDIFGSKINCKAYFEQYILAKITRPLALGLDEVNRVFSYPDIAVCKLIRNAEVLIPGGREAEWVAQFVRSQIIENWETKDEPEHLKTIRDRLLRDEQRTGRLLGLYQQILQNAQIVANDSPEQMELRLSGLVVKRDGTLLVYNPIYAQVFNLSWLNQILAQLRPYADALNAWIASDTKSDCENHLIIEKSSLEVKSMPKKAYLAPHFSSKELKQKFLS